MRKLYVVLALAMIFLAGAGLALAAEFGTAAEAQAMLQRAAAAIQADKAKALDMFTKGGGASRTGTSIPIAGARMGSSRLIPAWSARA